MKPKEILVIKLCCVGDVIFMTPALRELRRQHPDARITYLASPWVKDVVERIPIIDETIFWDSPYDSASPFRKAAATVAMIQLLRKRNFDRAIVAHRRSAFSLLTLFAGIGERIGFAGTRFLTHTVPFDAALHETKRYIALVEGLQGSAASSDPETFLVPKTSDVEFADRYFAEQKVDPACKVAGIFPGGGENPGSRMVIKRWDPGHYAKLIAALYDEFGIVPMLIGGKTDKSVIDEIVRSLGTNVPHISAVDAGGLGELCGLLKKCSVMIGSDSGPVHMAAALGIPTVMIFGPSDPALVRPLGPNHRSVRRKVWCSPCYTPSSVLDRSNYVGDSFVCRTKTLECMTLIGVEEVLVAAKQVMKT